jgi:hypothetical protein
LTSRVLDNLVGAVGSRIRAEHLRVFQKTPKGTLAQTLYAIGATRGRLTVKGWRHFRVILAHDDRMVNVSRMLRLLDDLGFAPNQFQVVWGDHYLFSGSDENRRLHLGNRETILGDILHLHEACREGQRLT